MLWLALVRHVKSPSLLLQQLLATAATTAVALAVWIRRTLSLTNAYIDAREEHTHSLLPLVSTFAAVRTHPADSAHHAAAITTRCDCRPTIDGV